MLEERLRIMLEINLGKFWEKSIFKNPLWRNCIEMSRKCIFLFFRNRCREHVFRNQRAKLCRMVVELSQLDRCLYSFLNFEISRTATSIEIKKFYGPPFFHLLKNINIETHQKSIQLRQLDHHSASFCMLIPKNTLPTSICKKSKNSFFDIPNINSL